MSDTKDTALDTSKKAEGNTITSAARRGRNWCFTLNNYTPEEIKNIQKIDADHVFQEEKGESGTPHLQGVVMFKNARTFKQVKMLIPRAHIEPTKNKISSIKYCSKPDTRVGQIYHRYGKFEQHRHKDTNKKPRKKIPSEDEKKNLIKKCVEELLEDKKDDEKIFKDHWEHSVGWLAAQELEESHSDSDVCQVNENWE